MGRGSGSIWCVETEWRRLDRHRWHRLGTVLGALQNLTCPSLVLLQKGIRVQLVLQFKVATATYTCKLVKDTSHLHKKLQVQTLLNRFKLG